MAFRSWALVSVFLCGCAAPPSGTTTTAARPGVLEAVNIALARRELHLDRGIPQIK